MYIEWALFYDNDTQARNFVNLENFIWDMELPDDSAKTERVSQESSAIGPDYAKSSNVPKRKKQRKSKDRKSKTQSQVENFVDADDTKGNELQTYNTLPITGRRSQSDSRRKSLAGRFRFSMGAKRSRSSSGIRNSAEYDDNNDTTSRYPQSDQPSDGTVQDSLHPCRRPRDRLRKMTVKEAMQEKKIMRQKSPHFSRNKKTVDYGEEGNITSSLPDLSVQGRRLKDNRTIFAPQQTNDKQPGDTRVAEEQKEEVKFYTLPGKSVSRADKRNKLLTQSTCESTYLEEFFDADDNIGCITQKVPSVGQHDIKPEHVDEKDDVDEYSKCTKDKDQRETTIEKENVPKKKMYKKKRTRTSRRGSDTMRQVSTKAGYDPICSKSKKIVHDDTNKELEPPETSDKTVRNEDQAKPLKNKRSDSLSLFLTMRQTRPLYSISSLTRNGEYNTNERTSSLERSPCKDLWNSQDHLINRKNRLPENRYNSYKTPRLYKSPTTSPTRNDAESCFDKQEPLRSLSNDDDRTMDKAESSQPSKYRRRYSSHHERRSREGDINKIPKDAPSKYIVSNENEVDFATNAETHHLTKDISKINKDIQKLLDKDETLDSNKASNIDAINSVSNERKSRTRHRKSRKRSLDETQFKNTSLTKLKFSDPEEDKPERKFSGDANLLSQREKETDPIVFDRRKCKSEKLRKQKSSFEIDTNEVSRIIDKEKYKIQKRRSNEFRHKSRATRSCSPTAGKRRSVSPDIVTNKTTPKSSEVPEKSQNDTLVSSVQKGSKSRKNKSKEKKEKRVAKIQKQKAEKCNKTTKDTDGKTTDTTRSKENTKQSEVLKKGDAIDNVVKSDEGVNDKSNSSPEPVTTRSEVDQIEIIDGGTHEVTTGDTETVKHELPKLSKLGSFKYRFSKKRKNSKRSSRCMDTNKEDELTKNDEVKSDVNNEDSPTPASVYIENETNLSKSLDLKETALLDDNQAEIIESIISGRKELRFNPIECKRKYRSEDDLDPATLQLQQRRDSKYARIRAKRKKVVKCCKTFAAFLFSHIGLLSLVVGYTILGGFVFRAIEQPFEKEIKMDIQRNRTVAVAKIWQWAVDLKMDGFLEKDNFTYEVEKEFKKFQHDIYVATKINGWNGDDSKDHSDPQWSIASSLLFAITVMTTIGK